MRRITMPQAPVSSQKSEKKDSISRSRMSNSERCAPLDITNDSPIIGLATWRGLSEKTPSSSAAKNPVRVKSTPGSGEALLRSQVKTLLQKVEEEAEFVINKVYLDFSSSSTVQLLAPTPANTPQVPTLSGLVDGDVVVVSSVVDEGESVLEINNAPIQLAKAVVKPEEPELSECLINRALLFDSPEKSEVTNSAAISSALSYRARSCSIRSNTEKSPKGDGSSSAWSTEVNVSVKDEDEDGEEYEEVEDYGEESSDDLCEGLSKLTVTGKHTRFVYNSDDEIEREEVVKENVSPSPGVVVLKGLPAPEGKHLRFRDDED